MRGLAAELRASGVESPKLEAERLACRALGLARHELTLSADEPLGAEEARRLAGLAARRLAGEPLQHVEGSVAFRELVLVADGRALIPRPETEELVDRVVAWARARSHRAAPGGVRPTRRPEAASEPLVDRALEIGTGSGAIALSLAVEGISGRVVATDVSEAALAQAEENRARLPAEAASRVELRRSSGPVWEPLREGELFDLIVSNPPYVAESELAGLAPEVSREPRVALAGGPDGMEVIREIARGVGERLLPGGALFLEIGAAQGEPVRRILEGTGGWAEVSVQRDLAGRERFVRGLRIG